MLVTPIAELKLLHNASFLKATSDRQKIVVASNQGDISVFDNLNRFFNQTTAKIPNSSQITIIKYLDRNNYTLFS